MRKDPQIRQKAIKLFKSHGGILKFSDVLKNGVHPRILQELLEDGLIEKCERGLYALKDFTGISNPDLVLVAKKIPNGVVCLISALYFHNLTLQIPRRIDVAIEQSCKPQVIKSPPVKFYWFTKKHHATGIEKHNFGGAEIKVYSPEKTIVDCFRFHRRIPLSVSIEALKTAYYERKIDLNKLINFAKSARIFNYMKPYMETIIHEQS